MSERYMKLAVELAEKTLGQTSPNPAVGCVIVKQGEIIGVGAHLKAGGPHAERHALAMAGENAEGAVMFVTLEPCSHYGRTPPCADAIIEAGIAKVVIASSDPNPKVSGGGIAKLKKAGIIVETGILKEEADALNRKFFHYITDKKPYVTLKSATSIDGKIATAGGESKWITGAEARMDGHRLRHEHDAILTGVETIINDDPSLTVRLESGGRNPVRIILDTTLRTPLNSRVVNDKEAETWIITAADAGGEARKQLEQKGVKVFHVTGTKILISELLTLLGENGITSLLVEGGGSVNDSFLRSGYFQQLVKYMAPVLIGGAEAKSSFSGQGIQYLNEAPSLKLEKMDYVGKDLKFVYIHEG